jgi:hypothetical protein
MAYFSFDENDDDTGRATAEIGEAGTTMLAGAGIDGSLATPRGVAALLSKTAILFWRPTRQGTGTRVVALMPKRVNIAKAKVMVHIYEDFYIYAIFRICPFVPWAAMSRVRECYEPTSFFFGPPLASLPSATLRSSRASTQFMLFRTLSGHPALLLTKSTKQVFGRTPRMSLLTRMLLVEVADIMQLFRAWYPVTS